MTAKIEQRRLFHDAAAAYALDQAVRVVGLVCLAAACDGPSDKHPAILHQSQSEISLIAKYYGTTFHFFKQTRHPCGFAGDEMGKWSKK